VRYEKTTVVDLKMFGRFNQQLHKRVFYLMWEDNMRIPPHTNKHKAWFIDRSIRVDGFTKRLQVTMLIKQTTSTNPNHGFFDALLAIGDEDLIVWKTTQKNNNSMKWTKTKEKRNKIPVEYHQVPLGWTFRNDDIRSEGVEYKPKPLKTPYGRNFGCVLELGVSILENDHDLLSLGLPRMEPQFDQKSWISNVQALEAQIRSKTTINKGKGKEDKKITINDVTNAHLPFGAAQCGPTPRFHNFLDYQAKDIIFKKHPIVSKFCKNEIIQHGSGMVLSASGMMKGCAVRNSLIDYQGKIDALLIPPFVHLLEVQTNFSGRMFGIPLIVGERLDIEDILQLHVVDLDGQITGLVKKWNGSWAGSIIFRVATKTSPIGLNGFKKMSTLGKKVEPFYPTPSPSIASTSAWVKDVQEKALFQNKPLLDEDIEEELETRWPTLNLSKTLSMVAPGVSCFEPRPLSLTDSKDIESEPSVISDNLIDFDDEVDLPHFLRRTEVENTPFRGIDEGTACVRCGDSSSKWMIRFQREKCKKCINEEKQLNTSGPTTIRKKCYRCGFIVNPIGHFIRSPTCKSPSGKSPNGFS
jgi:hypothetical protein